jgi:glycosyltransferase involved in cell wall biosynthesis
LSIKEQSRDERNTTRCEQSGSQLDPLRIAIILEDLRLPIDEGIKKAGFSLIRSFIKKGVKVSIFTRYANHLLKDVYPLPVNKLLLGYSFARNLRDQTPDVLLYIPASSGTLGAFARAAMIKVQCFGVPLAVLNLQYRELPAFAHYFGLHRYVDIVFAQSQASAEVYRSFGCNVILLPGGVDHSVYQPVSKQEKHLLRLEYSFQDADQIILHVGHCNPYRNVITLASLAKLGFKVVLIASTSTVVDVDLAAELRRAGVKVITNYLKNIQHFYQMADCYLFPVFCTTSAIDIPLSVLEAMACNLPVVTTRFGALPGMFSSGNGFYYGNTEDEIIRAVKDAVREQDCRTFEMVSPYSWDNIALAILKTLQETGNLWRSVLR